jgi:hypothetical protein
MPSRPGRIFNSPLEPGKDMKILFPFSVARWPQDAAEV